MTTQTSPSSTGAAPRRVGLARLALAGLAGIAVPVLLAGPASAAVPEGWSDPEAVDPFHTLLVLVGLPVLLFVVITAAVVLPAVVRGERIVPGAPDADNQWFGGPRTDHELESGTTSGETGGASGRW